MEVLPDFEFIIRQNSSLIQLDGVRLSVGVKLTSVRSSSARRCANPLH